MSTKPMPPCKIEFGATAEGVLRITYIFEGYEPSFTVINCGPILPSINDVKEIWRIATDPKEREPLRPIRNIVDGR